MNTKKIIILVICAIAFILGACALYVIILNNSHLNDGQEALDANNEETLPFSDKVVGYDFNKLSKTYPDIVAWLDVPNTNVSMPIVQSHEDDEYYLNHSAQRIFDQNGAAYIEMANNADFNDPVTVVYGHNMRDGGMFASIHNFENLQFFNDNPKFYVYVPNHKLTYTVVSAAVTDDKHILNSHDFSNEQIFIKYQKDIMSNLSTSKNVRQDVNMDASSKLLQLSTCMSDSNLSNQRYVVTGVLSNDQPTT